MYEKLNLIGRGANGDVYLGRNTTRGTYHVIKTLKMRDINQKQRETIENQLKLLQQFNHPNIVPFHDSFIDKQGSLNIVMTYCEGGDMHNLIQNAQQKKFSEKQVLDWIVQLALSILYMHERRVLHRDIKTQNIFLTSGRVMLGDFGVSKVLDKAADLARTNIGTPYYMSPEQYRNKPYSYKSDIWAFGCIVYEMCNHKHVFEALSLQALAVKVTRGAYAPISEFYSHHLKQLVNQMLNQNPKDRPSILQILKKPFLYKKVQQYMKEVYENRALYQPEQIQSLKTQAKSLGFSLQQQPKKSKNERTPSKSNKKERSQQKIKEQRGQKYEELKKKLQLQIQQRNKAQQKLKEYQKLSKINKKGSQKSIGVNSSNHGSIKSRRQSTTTQQSSVSSKFSGAYQKQYGSKSKPKLQQIDYKSKEENREKKVNISQKQEEKKEIKKEIKVQAKKQDKTDDKKEKKEDKTNKIDHKQQQVKPEKKQNKQNQKVQEKRENGEEKQIKQRIQKALESQFYNQKQAAKMDKFKMKEDYDMNYEDYEQQDEEQQKDNLNQIDQYEQYDQLQESEQKPSEKDTSADKQITKKPEVKQEKVQLISEDFSLVRKESAEDSIHQLKEQVKQKTIMISNIKNEITKLDFCLSSDSETQNRQKGYNPAYTRLTQRINDLKQKVITQLGRSGYSSFLNFVMGSKSKIQREQVINLIGQNNIGMWHLADNIVKMDKVLSKVPKYVS